MTQSTKHKKKVVVKKTTKGKQKGRKKGSKPLEKIPEAMKAISNLYFKKCYSGTDIAEELGYDKDAVYRAIKIIRERMKKEPMMGLDTNVVIRRVIESASLRNREAWKLHSELSQAHPIEGSASNDRNKIALLKLIGDAEEKTTNTLMRLGVIEEVPTRHEHEIKGVVEVAAERLDKYLQSQKKPKKNVAKKK